MRVTKAMLEEQNDWLRDQVAKKDAEIANGKEIINILERRPEASAMVAAERISQALADTLRIITEAEERRRKRNA